MVKFKLIDIIDGFYHYEIYPEGNISNKGIIIFNPITKQLKERVDPQAPYNDEKWINQAVSGFIDSNGRYKESGFVAWN